MRKLSMILQDVEKYRALCLELAVSICKDNGNTEAVTEEAEKYWQWLNGEKAKEPSAITQLIDPPLTSDDDIPF
jgi:hypothetical protein